MNRERDERGRPIYSADEVRQGEIVLRTRRRRIVFVAGLAGMAVLVLLTAIL